MNRLEMEVFGVPVPAGSKRAFVVKGKPILVDQSGERGRRWRAYLRMKAEEICSQTGWRPVPDIPLSLQVDFVFPLPKKYIGSNGQPKRGAPSYPTKRPDLTKLLRAIEDALTGFLWKDDSQIVRQVVTKSYSASLDSPPRARIVVERIE